MEIVKSSRTEWFIITQNAKEKRKVLKIIGKREPSAVYYYPDGRKEEQFTVTPKEVDLINGKIRSG